MISSRADQAGKKIQIAPDCLSAKPRDINETDGYRGDKRTLDKLVDTVNITNNEGHMWLSSLAHTKPTILNIRFPREQIVSAIKFWNYNASKEESLKGVQLVAISADNKYVTSKKGILLRKAPGSAIFDFGQTIELPYEKGWSQNIVQLLKMNPLA